MAAVPNISLSASARMLGAAASSLVVGVAIGHGGPIPTLVAAALCGLALFFIVGRLGNLAIGVWAVLSVVAYPFLRYPSTHPLVTFDRAWIAASLALIVLKRDWCATSSPSRRLVVALAWLTATFALRAFVTHSSPDTSALGIWVDALVLPLILFSVTRRLVTTPGRCRQLAGAMTIAGVVLGAIGIAERVAGFELASRSGAVAKFDAAVGLVRISGPYPYAEMFGLVLLCCFAATLYWIQATGASALVLGGLAASIESAAVAITLFRSAWLGLVIVVIAAFGLRPRRFRRLIGACAVVAAGLFVFSGSLEANQTFETRASNTSNVNSRFATYRQGLTIWGSAPLFGVGITEYTTAAGAHPAERVDGTPSVPYPHSSYVWMLAEEGLVGFLPLVACTLAAWGALRALRRRAEGRDDVLLAAAASGAAGAYLLMSLTLTMLPYGPSNAFFALLLGAVCGRLDAIGERP